MNWNPTSILEHRYRDIRERSEALCQPLCVEDHVPQPMTDVSPPKWHLGHVTWFFEALILRAHVPGYTEFNPHFAHIFNSYYEALGQRVARAHRGFLSRPTVEQVMDYRAHVDAAMLHLLAQEQPAEVLSLVELGLQHEQQHQELLVTDIKFILGTNPMRPAYSEARTQALAVDAEHDGQCPPQDVWVALEPGQVAIGHTGNSFAYDNEQPRHQVHLPGVEIRDHLVSNAEFLAFINDKAYERFELWLAEGWDWVQSHSLHAPLYWQRDEHAPLGWSHYSLQGLRALEPTSPVTHVNFYEAAAFCRWAGWRLPTEFEWEALAMQLRWGRRWEWTASAYLPYPGFRELQGAAAEYNGKFMINQMVLRGASFATPPGHARLTYRNFFHPSARWQYSGIRPARERP